MKRNKLFEVECIACHQILKAFEMDEHLKACQAAHEERVQQRHAGANSPDARAPPFAAFDEYDPLPTTARPPAARARRRRAAARRARAAAAAAPAAARSRAAASTRTSASARGAGARQAGTCTIAARCACTASTGFGSAPGRGAFCRGRRARAPRVAEPVVPRRAPRQLARGERRVPRVGRARARARARAHAPARSARTRRRRSRAGPGARRGLAVGLVRPTVEPAQPEQSDGESGARLQQPARPRRVRRAAASSLRGGVSGGFERNASASLLVSPLSRSPSAHKEAFGVRPSHLRHHVNSLPLTVAHSWGMQVFERPGTSPASYGRTVRSYDSHR